MIMPGTNHTFLIAIMVAATCTACPTWITWAVLLIITLNLMQTLSIEATADLLTSATLVQSLDLGMVIAHKGISADGTPFVLVNTGTTGESIIIKL
jgi:hypothetical protein